MTETKLDLRAVPEAEWTDEHEAELRRRVAEDPNDWMPSEAELAQAKPFAAFDAEQCQDRRDNWFTVVFIIAATGLLIWWLR